MAYLLSIRNFHQSNCASGGGIDGGDNGGKNGLYQWPATPTEDDDGDAARTEVLLIAQVLIGCEEHLETGSLGRGEQLTVGERVPAHGAGDFDSMVGQSLGDTARRSVIK